MSRKAGTLPVRFLSYNASMEASQALVEVISEIRSLKAECELLLKVVEVIDEPPGPGHSGSEDTPFNLHEEPPLLYLA